MQRLSPLLRLIAVTVLIGVPFGVFSVINSRHDPLTVPWAGVALLAVALIIGEALPVRLATGGAVTFSGGFTLALVLVAPLHIALLLHVAVTLFEDLRARSKWYWLPFNIAQYCLLFSLTHWAFKLVSGTPLLLGDTPSRAQLFGVLVAGFTYLFVNHTLFTLVIAIAENLSFRRLFTANALTKVLPFGMDLAVAPLSVAALRYSVWLVPLLMLPTVIMHRSAKITTQREHQALHDGLTGLPNRAKLARRVETLEKTLESGNAPLAVLLVDLDHFKEINDTLGHSVGDELLCDVARRLLSVIREGDMACRLGGDEFAILATLDAQAPRAEAEGLATRIVAVLDEPFVTDGVRIDVQGSVGIAVAPEHGSDMEVLMSRADIALYLAKEKRGCWAVFDGTAEAQGSERLSMLGELRDGLGRGELVLHYQPKWDLGSETVIGVEALMRWQHPRRGLLLPQEFLSTAENTGLIIPMTLSILDEALAQTRRWRDAGRSMSLTINLSARHLTDLQLPDTVLAALQLHGVPAEMLVFDVTEDAIMTDPTRSASVLHQLRRLGVSIAVDDYGTGYSSLAYLRRLDLDELKIDRSFISGMQGSSGDDVIVRSTIELGHNLGLRVLAEGVEDGETAARLKAMGCSLIQGYAVCRPLPADELEAWFREHENAGAPYSDQVRATT